ncbi:MAG: hypothetical protein UV57_C0002G0012 [Parcubacteria group bacterium GW2011_GWD2_43_10]|uniref:General secretion pathway GspH domain-containing protein n=4 Tax=Candidatus Vebleniibacteriota TaxID=1817921 RepID=A0A1G2Q7B7_9BACT|nr:MAG: hypothetical protein UV47_C0004G0011 [Parcubacteria group bacterium GW2011_GWA2_42_80]KKS79632.1 MAG: hypothetical protein UV52_C0005G0010 [Parcubacteria group bacterium GW2011_GWD1_42_9]KKS84051.1 MAG: hypothetical protein UV57_C0002G0012 [Parcubacteria group bacterium GW2011_GWD2_43_10]KKS93236.1 MAG: hypothetical protein UV69_C0010G0008 [Parcubacteria group bacterium GW2011_GWE2_43_12]KKT14144.1 MAG: hypothetical protein UV92_C0005G0007 [Parcubacteria group bacterium GW2011_GWA1_43_2
MQRAGFTIFEVTVVVGIVVLVIISSLPAIRTAQINSTLKREGRSLLSDLRLAQQLTLGEQTTHLVKLFNTTPQKYQLIARLASDTIIKEHELNNKITWQDMGGFTNNEIIFTISGSAVEAGTIVLQNTNGLTTSLEVKPSGYVKVN